MNLLLEAHYKKKEIIVRNDFFNRDFNETMNKIQLLSNQAMEQRTPFL